MNAAVGFEFGGLESRFDHTKPAVREDRPLERLIRLQAYDDFVVAVDIADLVSQHTGGRRLIDSLLRSQAQDQMNHLRRGAGAGLKAEFAEYLAHSTVLRQHLGDQLC